MAKKPVTQASKLGYEDAWFTTIDGRKLKMGDYFKPNDFAIDTGGDRQQAVIKHDGMQRVLFDLFDVREKNLEVHQCPLKANEWCAVVSVSMRVVPKVHAVVDDEGTVEEVGMPYVWQAAADCRTGNAMPGMSRYTTAIAETRASGRVIRRLLGLEEFCTKEELAETTLDVDDDTGPVQSSQILLLKKFLNDPAKKYADVTIDTINKRLKRKFDDDNFITNDDMEDEKALKEKLTVGQAAGLIQKLHTYDVLKAEE